MSESVNKTLSDAEKIFKDLLWDVGVTALKTYLRGLVSFLNWPIVSRVFEAIVLKASEWLFDIIVTTIDVDYIRITDPLHRATYDSAQLKLKLIAHSKGIDSDEFKKARDEARASLSTFVRLG